MMQTPLPAASRHRREASDTITRRHHGGAKLSYILLACLPAVLITVSRQIVQSSTCSLRLGLDAVSSDLHLIQVAASTKGRHSPEPNASRPFQVIQPNFREIGLVPPPPLKVPLPIFVLSLPKSGTTSTQAYFECGRQKSVHHALRNDTEHITAIGQCWGNNYRNGRPMLEGCGSAQVFADIGYIFAWYEYKDNIANGHLNCFYPSVHGLDNIAKFYPNATVVLVNRNETTWAQSLMRWQGLDVRWKKECDGFPKGDPNDGNRTTMQDYEQFYLQHNANVRRFAKQNPSLTYIEVDLESDDSGAILEDAIGISRKCWGNCPAYMVTRKCIRDKEMEAERIAALAASNATATL